MRVAIRDIIKREDLTWDPFLRIKQAPEKLNEKGILSFEEVSALICSPVKSPQSRLALLLGMLCGMRRGEIRGLKWADVQDDVINIKNNWQDLEGIKKPKYGSAGIVPLPASAKDILDGLKKKTYVKEQLVFESSQYKGKPVSNNFFRYSLKKELISIGISAEEQKRRNITFHSLRHTFITLGRLAGISDLEIQALARHKNSGMMNRSAKYKDSAMMDRYSHAEQVVDFQAAKEKLEKMLAAAADNELSNKVRQA
jgi:integrase